MTGVKEARGWGCVWVGACTETTGWHWPRGAVVQVKVVGVDRLSRRAEPGDRVDHNDSCSHEQQGEPKDGTKV